MPEASVNPDLSCRKLAQRIQPQKTSRLAPNERSPPPPLCQIRSSPRRIVKICRVCPKLTYVPHAGVIARVTRNIRRTRWYQIDIHTAAGYQNLISIRPPDIKIWYQYGHRISKFDINTATGYQNLISDGPSDIKNAKFLIFYYLE
jgi:hypothetical protein